MSGHDGRAREISKNEVLLANERAKFDAWLEQNAGMEGQKEYQDYVSNFRTWEKNIEQRQRELRDSIARQPVVETPTLPGQSLDEQVAEAVKNISINDFLTALLSLAKDNPSFVPKLEQVRCLTLFSHSRSRLSSGRRRAPASTTRRWGRRPPCRP